MKYQKLKLLFEVSRGYFEKGETVLDKGASRWDVLTYLYTHIDTNTFYYRIVIHHMYFLCTLFTEPCFNS